MKKIRVLLLILLLTGSAHAASGFYLGGQVGHVALMNSSHGNAIGFGIDLGYRTNPILDVIFSSQYSSHNGPGNGLKIYSERITANFHLFEANDFDFMANIGPGFYFLETAGVSSTKFGIHFGVTADVMITEQFRIGIAWNWHQVFDSKNYLTTMMNFGYFFGS